MLLYIIRHGDPIYGPVEQLTETGHKQAKALVPRMVQSGITKIYSSPLRRARETAQPTAEALGMTINIEPWCSEGLAWSRFTKKTPSGGTTWIWNSDDPGEYVRNGNFCFDNDWYAQGSLTERPDLKANYEKLQQESDAFFARQGYVRDGNEYIITSPSDERIAVFCHAGFGTTWLSHLLRIPPNIVWTEFDMTHTGVTIFSFANYACGRTVPKCLCLSDMSHLFASPDCEYLYNTRDKI